MSAILFLPQLIEFLRHKSVGGIATERATLNQLNHQLAASNKYWLTYSLTPPPLSMPPTAQHSMQDQVHLCERKLIYLRVRSASCGLVVWAPMIRKRLKKQIVVIVLDTCSHNRNYCWCNHSYCSRVFWVLVLNWQLVRRWSYL